MIDIIDPSVQKIEEHNHLKKIELCGRVCYKSEDKICDGSAERLIKGIIKRGHESVLEHFRITLKSDDINAIFSNDSHFVNENERYIEFALGISNPEKFLNRISENEIESNVRGWRNFFKSNHNQVLCQFKHDFPIIFDDINPEISGKSLGNVELFETKNYHTFRIITGRGVTHEIVRHRVFSFSQESTRYCNYAGKNIKFISPIPFPWAKNNMSPIYRSWRNSCSRCAMDYEEMISEGCTPQMARDVLNNSVKTEIMMTGLDVWWNECVKTRCDQADNTETRIFAELITSQM